jgi:hypothetical protein
MSQEDSQATVIIEDDTFNPIRLIDCATLVEPGRRITRRMGIFQYEGKGITAFYQGSGTSGAPALKGTYLPFYGETNKLLKAIDVFLNTQSNPWKISLRNVHEIRIDHSVLNYFSRFEDLQISASIDSQFWNGLSYRDFILSHDFNEDTGEFVLLSDPIPHTAHFSEMPCDKHIEMEKGEINDFLRSSGATLGEGIIEEYQLQQKKEAERLAEMYALHQEQLEEEDIKEPLRGLKIDKGGKSLKKRRKTRNQKKSKKLKKRRKTKKSKKYK